MYGICICCADDIAATEVRASLKLPLKREPSKGKTSNDTIIASEINTIKDATDVNTAEIVEIKAMTAKTEAVVQKATERSATPNQLNATPKAGQAMKYHQAFRNRATAAAAASAKSTPKRKRSVSPEPHCQRQRQQKFPTPKVGTKPNANGLTAARKPERIDKPSFERALFVSGLDPATTNEQLSDYIVENTSVIDKTKFNVHKMVKKDADVSSLKFVSSKVAMNVDELDVLDNKELWPEGVRVREFQQVPKNDLGRHFPSLPTTEKSKEVNSNEMNDPMEV